MNLTWNYLFLYAICDETRKGKDFVTWYKLTSAVCRKPDSETSLHSILLAVVFLSGVRKQPTFCDATTNFPSKWCLRNKGRNSMLMTYRYPDISSASDWLDICFNQSEALFRSGLWVERHRYGTNYCASGFHTWSRGETRGGVSKCRLFSQAHFSELGGKKEMFQNSNSGNSHEIDWNIKITSQVINRHTNNILQKRGLKLVIFSVLCQELHHSLCKFLWFFNNKPVPAVRYKLDVSSGK